MVGCGKVLGERERVERRPWWGLQGYCVLGCVKCFQVWGESFVAEGEDGRERKRGGEEERERKRY